MIEEIDRVNDESLFFSIMQRVFYSNPSLRLLFI